MKKITLILLIFVSLVAHSEDVYEIITSNDSTLLDDESHIIIFGITYSTNNTENKNFLDIKMPSIIGDVYFYGKSGIWSGFSYTNYIEAETNTYETELNLGYQKYIFNNFLDFDISYSWHQFKGDTLYAGIEYQHRIDLSTGIDIGPTTFSIDNSIFFGESNNYFLDFNYGLNINADGVFLKTDNLYLSPTISISFGTNDFIVRDIIQKQIRRKAVIINMNRPVLLTQTNFLYQNLGFFLPLIYTIDSFSIMAAYMYNIPSNKLKQYSWTNQSSFFISLSYSPNLFK